MWTRVNLKDRAKAGLKRNYWKSIVFAFILTMLVTAGTASGRSGSDGASLGEILGGLSGAQMGFLAGVGIFGVLLGVLIRAVIYNPLKVGICKFAVDAVEDTGSWKSIQVGWKPKEPLNKSSSTEQRIFFTSCAVPKVGNTYSIPPLLEPSSGEKSLAVSSRRFNQSFPKFLSNVWALLLRDVVVCLWSLLLVVPGVVMAYAYSQVEYILAENPGMSAKEAMAKSKAMTQGSKWNMFVLDLSFLGWDILSGITLGILGIFYVAPYKMLTKAALYEEIRKNA